MRIFDLFREDDSQLELKPQQPQVKTPNPTDRVTMDIPLLLRIMEYSKEDAKTDMDLHHVTEKLIELSRNGQPLSMKDYESIVGPVSEVKDQEPMAPAEKLIHDIEYQPDDDDEDLEEGHGRYWCSTDKRWKERKGPKQSRG